MFRSQSGSFQRCKSISFPLQICHDCMVFWCWRKSRSQKEIQEFSWYDQLFTVSSNLYNHHNIVLGYHWLIRINVRDAHPWPDPTKAVCIWKWTSVQNTNNNNSTLSMLQLALSNWIMHFKRHTFTKHVLQVFVSSEGAAWTQSSSSHDSLAWLMVLDQIV